MSFRRSRAHKSFCSSSPRLASSTHSPRRSYSRSSPSLRARTSSKHVSTRRMAPSPPQCLLASPLVVRTQSQAPCTTVPRLAAPPMSQVDSPLALEAARGRTTTTMTRMRATASRTMKRVRASAVAHPPPLAAALPPHPHRPPLRLALQRAPQTPLLVRPASHLPQAHRARRHTRVRSLCLRSPVLPPLSRFLVAASKCQDSSSSTPRARASSSPADSRHPPATRMPRPRRTEHRLRRATRACTDRPLQDTRDMWRLHRMASRGMTQERLVLGRALPECRRATGAHRPYSRAATMLRGDEQVTAAGVLAPALSG